MGPGPHHFRFENWWLLEEDYESTAKNSWNKSANRPFHHKTNYVAFGLKNGTVKNLELMNFLLKWKNKIYKRNLFTLFSKILLCRLI
jgi:hypothetical protein